jgi:hypothetical protein
MNYRDANSQNSKKFTFYPRSHLFTVQQLIDLAFLMLVNPSLKLI